MKNLNRSDEPEQQQQQQNMVPPSFPIPLGAAPSSYSMPTSGSRIAASLETSFAAPQQLLPSDANANLDKYQPTAIRHTVEFLMGEYARCKLTGVLSARESDRLFSLAPAPNDRSNTNVPVESPMESWTTRRPAASLPKPWEAGPPSDANADARMGRGRGRPPGSVVAGRGRGRGGYRPPGLADSRPGDDWHYHNDVGDPSSSASRAKQVDSGWAVPSWRRRDRSLSDSHDLPPAADVPVSRPPPGPPVPSSVAAQFPTSTYNNNNVSPGATSAVLGPASSGPLGRAGSFAKLERVPDRRVAIPALAPASRPKVAGAEEERAAVRRSAEGLADPHHVPNSQTGTFGIRDANWVEDDWRTIGDRRGVSREGESDWWKKTDSKESDDMASGANEALGGAAQHVHRSANEAVSWEPVGVRQQESTPISSAALSMLLSTIQEKELPNIQKMSAAELLEKLQSSLMAQNQQERSAIIPNKPAPDPQADFLALRQSAASVHHQPQFPAPSFDVPMLDPLSLSTRTRPSTLTSSLVDVPAPVSYSGSGSSLGYHQQRSFPSAQAPPPPSSREIQAESACLNAEVQRRNYATCSSHGPDGRSQPSELPGNLPIRMGTTDVAADLIRRLTAPSMQNDFLLSAVQDFGRAPPTLPPVMRDPSTVPSHLTFGSLTENFSWLSQQPRPPPPAVLLPQDASDSVNKTTAAKPAVPAVTAPPLPPAAAPVCVEPEQRKNDAIWEYKDPTGTVQGPFTATQMRAWWQGNFFPSDLLMRYRPGMAWTAFCDLYPPALNSVRPPFSEIPPPAAPTGEATAATTYGKDRHSPIWQEPIFPTRRESGGIYMSRAAEMTEGLKAMLGLEKEAPVVEPKVDEDDDVLPPFSTCVPDQQEPASIWQPVKVARRSSEKKKKVEATPVPAPKQAPASPPILPQDESLVFCRPSLPEEKPRAAREDRAKQWKTEPYEAAGSLDDSEFPDPVDLFSKAPPAKKASGGKKPQICVDSSNKKSLREFFKSELSSSVPAKPVWAVSQPQHMSSNGRDSGEAKQSYGEECRQVSESSQHIETYQESLAAAPQESSWVTVSKRKQEPAALSSVPVTQQPSAAAAAAASPVPKQVHQIPSSSSNDFAKSSLTAEEKMEINKLMVASKIELDDSLVEYLRELKTTDAIIDFLRDSVPDPSVLEPFATEFIGILRNPFRTVSYTKPTASAWHSKSVEEKKPQQAANAWNKTHTQATTSKKPQATSQAVATTAAGVTKKTKEPKTWARAPAPLSTPALDMTEEEPAAALGSSQRAQPPPVAKQRAKRGSKGVSVHPSLLGFSVKSNRIMQGTIDYGD